MCNDNDYIKERLSLTVKPKPKLNESLSSYIVRVATENGISALDIIKYINKGSTQYYIMYPYLHKLDWVGEHLDMDKLSMELGVGKELLQGLTFSSLLKYFSVCGTDYTPGYKQSLGKEINTQTRRYCPICLSTIGIYKLIWQISDICCCIEHRTPLEDTCSSCRKSLPYVFETMALHMCPHCATSLNIFQNQVQSIDIDVIEQRRIYSDWNYLLEGNLSLINTELSVSQSLVCKILYLSSEDGYKSHYQRKKIRYFERDRIKGYATYIRNPLGLSSLKPNLQDIFHLCKSENIRVEELFNIEIPTSFLDSFSIIDPPEYKLGECLAPWCKYFQNPEGMMELISTAQKERKIQKKGRSYKNLYACTGCYMRYGRHSVGDWHEIDDRIQMIWFKVRPLFNMRFTRYKICKELGITNSKCNEYLGYMLHHNMLHEDIKKKYTPSHIPEDIVEKFIDLKYSYSPNAQLSGRIAIKKFGWTIIQFYYYAFYKLVQEYQNFGKVGPLFDTSHRIEPLKHKINRTIRELYKKQILVTHDKVAQEVGCAVNTISYHGFSESISQHKKKQLQDMKERSGVEIYQLYEEYKKEVLQKDGILLIGKICEHLGYGYRYIKRDFPKIALMIVNDVRESKLKDNKKYVAQKHMEIIAAIKLLIDIDEQPSIKSVGKIIGLTSLSTQSVRGNQILNLIRTEIEGLIE